MITPPDCPSSCQFCVCANECDWLKENDMGLFKALAQIATLPVRVAVDVVKLPVNLMDGRDLAPSTSDGLKKLEEDLND